MQVFNDIVTSLCNDVVKALPTSEIVAFMVLKITSAGISSEESPIRSCALQSAHRLQTGVAEAIIEAIWFNLFQNPQKMWCIWSLM